MRIVWSLGAVSLGLLFGFGCSSASRTPAAAVDAGTDAQPVFSEGDGAPACTPSEANFEVPDNGCDDDGDGEADNVAECDDSLDVGGDAEDFAKALGICQEAKGKKWGLVSAEFTSSWGSSSPPSPQQHGILTKFGSVIRPQEGAAFGVISSGWAREFNGPSNGSFQSGQAMTGSGTVPPGFPKPAQNCDIDDSVNDVITVKLTLKAPANAKGLAFDFNFFSGEWPQYVCTRFNDGFAAMLTSSAFNDGDPDNISFDSQNNPVSVNNGFFDRCTPNTTTGCSGLSTKVAKCPGGDSELKGTGFYALGKYCANKQSTGGGATGWLTSSAPVAANEEVTLEFLIWDTGDARFDSSVLLDKFRWELGETQTKTERPK